MARSMRWTIVGPSNPLKAWFALKVKVFGLVTVPPSPDDVGSR
jgi:hypothetical protein